MTTFDPRLLAILKTVALDPLCYDEEGCPKCAYCDYAPERASLPSFPGALQQHEQDCPVLLSRAVLKELGMPLSTYHVSWQHQVAGGAWQLFIDEVDACSPEDAIEYERAKPYWFLVRDTMRHFTAIAVKEVIS